MSVLAGQGLVGRGRLTPIQDTVPAARIPAYRDAIPINRPMRTAEDAVFDQPALCCTLGRSGRARLNLPESPPSGYFLNRPPSVSMIVLEKPVGSLQDHIELTKSNITIQQPTMIKVVNVKPASVAIPQSTSTGMAS